MFCCYVSVVVIYPVESLCSQSRTSRAIRLHRVAEPSKRAGSMSHVSTNMCSIYHRSKIREVRY
jgi:hypothetical protein